MTALAPPFYTVPDNSSICRDFTPTTVGQVSSFAVNNVPVSAHLTRTVGFWTNWSSVNGGRTVAEARSNVGGFRTRRHLDREPRSAWQHQ
jgi:hypothetical protein